MTHQQRHNLKMTAYEEMGMAAMLPGMVHLHTLMGRAIDEMRAALARTQERKEALAGGYEAERPVVGRKTGTPQGRYWASMTPEERSAEMRRRGMMGRGKAKVQKKVKGMHPRDPRHPEHAAYLKKLRKGQLNFWNNLSPEERTKRVNTMQTGRAA